MRITKQLIILNTANTLMMLYKTIDVIDSFEMTDCMDCPYFKAYKGNTIVGTIPQGEDNENP